MDPNKLGEILAFIAALVTQVIIGAVGFIIFFWIFFQIVN